jgi:hypothetical protein
MPMENIRAKPFSITFKADSSKKIMQNAAFKISVFANCNLQEFFLCLTIEDLFSAQAARGWDCSGSIL